MACGYSFGAGRTGKVSRIDGIAAASMITCAAGTLGLALITRGIASPVAAEAAQLAFIAALVSLGASVLLASVFARPTAHPAITALMAAFAAAAPFAAVGAASMFAAPLVAIPWTDAGHSVDARTIGIASFVSAVLARAVAHTAASPARIDRRTGLIAIVLTAIAAALAAVSLHRARLPEPSEYVSSLPSPGAVPAAIGPPTRFESGRPWSWTPTGVYDKEVGIVTTHRLCEGHVCGLVIGPITPGQGLWSQGSVRSFAASPLDVRWDEARGLWIIEQSDGVRAMKGGKLTEVRIADVADGVRPPWGWIGLAAAGAAAGALGLLAAGRWAGRRRHALASAVDGWLGADGWISLGESPPRRAPTGLPPGPVVVLGAPTGQGAYRDLASANALAGSRAELEAGTLASVAAWRGLVIALVLLTAAPLAAACALGLVL